MGRPRKPVAVLARRGNRYWVYKTEYHDRYEKTPVEIRHNKAGKPTSASRAEAEEFAHRKLIEIEHRYGGAASKTYRRLLRDAWLKDRDPRLVAVFVDWDGTGRPPVSERYILEARKRIERYILADDELAAARPEDGIAPWQSWKSRMKSRGVGARTINETMKNVGTLLRYLERLNEISNNPIPAVPRMQEPKVETGIFAPAEIAQIVAHPEWLRYTHTQNGKRVDRTVQTHKHLPERYALVVLMLSTMARPSELFRVQWADVDLEEATLRLRETKTGKPRVVPLTRHAVAALEAHRDNTIFVAAEHLVFGEADGGAQHPRGGKFTDRIFRTLLRNSGLPAEDADGRRRRFYSLKHSMLTAALEAGVSPIDVAGIAGHSTGSLGSWALTAAQRHYHKQRVEHLRERVVPVLEGILDGTHITEDAT